MADVGEEHALKLYERFIDFDSSFWYWYLTTSRKEERRAWREVVKIEVEEKQAQ